MEISWGKGISLMLRPHI